MGKCFEQNKAFPIIRRIIFDIYHEKINQVYHRTLTKEPEIFGTIEVPVILKPLPKTNFVLHDDIVDRLLTSKEGRYIINDAHGRCPEHTEYWLASQMVQWWSQRFTVAANKWSHGLDRDDEIDNDWAYRPKENVKY